MVFGVSRPKRLCVVGVKEFGKARQELERRDVVGFGDGVRRRAYPLSETCVRPPQAVRDGVGRKLWHLAEALSEPRQELREDLVPGVPPFPPVASYTALTIFGASSFSPLKFGTAAATESLELTGLVFWRFPTFRA